MRSARWGCLILLSRLFVLSMTPLFKEGERAFERMDPRLAPHAFAAALEAQSLAENPGTPSAFCRPGEAHHSYRLRSRSARGPGDAGDRERKRAFAALEGAERHLARGLLAHGAMLEQGL